MKSALLLMAMTVALVGCDDMSIQPKQRHYSPEVAPVTMPTGTVEYRDKSAQAPPLTMALLERGRERFRIYCTPCHSELGDGQGMIVQRGFPAPPSYHIDRLRTAPIQHFYEVMTQGYGAMYPFADRVSPQDRWAIAAYIRALQKSQAVSVADIPQSDRETLP